MRNVLFLLFFLTLSLAGCNDSDDPVISTLEIKDNKTELYFDSGKSTQTIEIITNRANDLTLSTEQNQTWYTAKLDGKSLTIEVEPCATDVRRESTITISLEQQSVKVKIVQEEESLPALAEDTKLTIASATASSEETVNDNTDISKSYDGDFNTFWHTKWSDGVPYTITYNLKDAAKLDYILYYPRTPSGGNGNFGVVNIYVSTTDNSSDFKLVLENYDLKQSGSVSKIVLPSSITKPVSVKFEILSGSNGNASCSEMEFYSTKAETLETVEIPIGGNTYVTTGEGTVGDAGILNWNSLETVYSSYFKVNKAGSLNLYLKYSADGDNNVINVTVLGKTYVVNLAKGLSTIPVGKINVAQAGYIKVDFQGNTLNSSTFGTIQSLIVSGDASNDLTFVGDFSYYWGRRGPSVHMRYTIPNNQQYEWLYNEVTVPEGYDIEGSYFMANGFGEGYFGMQVNYPTERRVLFSVWSPYETDNPNEIPEEDRVLLVKKGEGVTVQDFGAEGSGGQSYLVYMWKPGVTYKFLNRVRPIENNRTEYTAYFYAPEVGQWRLIAQWTRPKIQTYYTGAHSFVENFNPEMGAYTRKANFGNQWIYTTTGQWVELTVGTFTTDETGNDGWRMDYLGGDDKSSFFLQMGGFFNENTPYGSQFTRTATKVAPSIDWSELE